MRDLGYFRNIAFPEELLYCKRMPTVSSAAMTEALGKKTYPFEPAKRKLFGNSRFNAAQKSSFSSSDSPRTLL